jgi:DNA polymerase-3 subunit epsilon
LLSMLPISTSNQESQLDFVKETLNEYKDFHTVTIRMVGSFFDSLLKLNAQIPKISIDAKEKIISSLYKCHLGQEFTPDDKIPLKENIFHKMQFLIVPHLIPEQFVIYPLAQLHVKNELIFRYPGHKKKFIQYVNNQAKKMTSDKAKMRKNTIHKDLVTFFNLYLKGKLDEESSTHLFLSKDIVNAGSKFHGLMEDFFSENKKAYNYPKEHV